MSFGLKKCRADIANFPLEKLRELKRACEERIEYLEERDKFLNEFAIFQLRMG